DADGEPVGGASVVALPAGDGLPGEELAAIEGASVGGPGVAESAAAPRDRVLAPDRTDARGRFEIRGEAGSEKLSLVAQKEGLAGKPVAVRAGERDARLVLGAAASIEGVVRLDPSLS